MAWYINKGKNAVPTNRGWENSVTGEVYISHRGLKDKMIAAGHLVEKAAPVKKEVKKVEESSLSSMTKDQLEAYAQEKFDVDLDKHEFLLPQNSIKLSVSIIEPTESQFFHSQLS